MNRFRIAPATLIVASASFFAAMTDQAAEGTYGDSSRTKSGMIASQPGATAAEILPKNPSALDRLWDAPTIYKNEESAFLNEFRFVGRLHLDQYIVDSDLGHDQDWIVRRLRLGAKAQFFRRHLTAHAEFEFDPQDDHPAYQRLTDFSLSWKFSDDFKLTVGKQLMRFTLDGSTSSNELLTIDRNNLSNNLWFAAAFAPGVTVTGKFGSWVYHFGGFSSGSESRELGNFDAGNFGLASLGYDFGHRLGVKKMLLRADYVYNQRDPESTFARSLENVGSLVFILDHDRWGFLADVSRATGYRGQGDLTGAVGMPWFNLTKHLQVVGRYTYIRGDAPNSVRFARYESFVSSDRGDEYNEVYAGLNYYLHGHKMKVQTGCSYTTMHDEAGDGGRYAGWSWVTALRVSW